MEDGALSNEVFAAASCIDSLTKAQPSPNCSRYLISYAERDTITTEEEKQVAGQYGIHVYPNPLVDGSNVTVAVTSAKDTQGEEATVYVLDNTGKILFSQKQITTTPSKIDLSAYSSGVYYIKVAIKKEQLFLQGGKGKVEGLD